jgi:serine/threonine protein kinase
MISNEGEVKLTDFGVARIAHGETTDPERRIGKSAYMPPEVLYEGAAFREPRCDIYSLGVVLEEMLSNHDPAAPGMPPEPPPRPPALAAIVRRARCRDPGSRLASASELRAELDAFLRAECEGPVPAAAIGAFAREVLSHIEPPAPSPWSDTAPARRSLIDEAALEF